MLATTNDPASNDAVSNDPSVSATDRLARLQEIDRRKDKFLARLVHELGNYLAPIHYSAYLLRAASDPNTLDQARKTIEQQVQEVKGLLGRLRDISRVSYGRLDEQPQRCDAAAIARRAADRVRPLVEKGQVELTAEFPPAPVFIQVDPARLEEMLFNLLENAVRFTPGGGQVWFSTAIEDDQLVFRVRDSGIGIGPEVLPRVFDPFFTAEELPEYTTSTHLGVGLALVKRLAEQYHGAVTASSAGQDQGSEFTLRLPLEPPM
jgi:signal transduction histidine kinase